MSPLITRLFRIVPTAGGLAALAIVSLSCAGGHEVDFNRDVRPILNEHCVSCHGGIRRQGDLSLLFRADVLKPAESGRRAIVPFDADGSELIRRVGHADPDERMPQEDEPLSDNEIQILRKWIESGAPWDAHWAYVAPVNPELPAVSDPSWPSADLDRFVLAQLDRVGLVPSPPASCPVLLRRISLDLVGLPPAANHVAAICRNASERGYARFVDSLLALPAYGEHWAAMWLDLARYADSKGYEKDIPRTIWRWRDWVIRAFNDDMPFDRFTVEQLAGDLLPNATEAQLIATAFHRNTMTNTEGGTDDEEFRIAAIVDRVNTTWEVWQGTSFGCVQCHGHPYDPFRHRDYYSFLAFFNNTADNDQDNESPTLPLFREEHREKGYALLSDIEKIDEQMLSLVRTPELIEARRVWEENLDDPAVVGKVEGRAQNEVLRITATEETERDAGQVAFIEAVFGEVHDDPRLVDLRNERKEKRIAVQELKPVLTPIMREVSEHARRTTYVHERGNFLLRGKFVEPDVPDVLPSLADDASRDRLSMAEWLVGTDNPLTARVTVNRFWERLFGRGIVNTLEDFGTQGELPSHPRLLDYLAHRFMHDHAWSIKALLRDIVLSATYRQSSEVTPDLLAHDPDNLLLARGPRFRLTAEQIRDQALAVSGLLSDKMYGPSVMPPQPDGLWQNPYDPATWQASYDEDRYRRGLYTYWRRTVPYPSMATFDSPSREYCVSRRIRTNTPLQALVVLNDPGFVEAAQALGRRMAEKPMPDEQLALGWRLALAREAATEELSTLRTLYNDALDYYTRAPDDAAAITGGTESAKLAAATVAANAILNLDAFLTKE